MPDLASDLRSYVDRLAELAEEHAAVASDPRTTTRPGASIPGLRRLRRRPGRRAGVAAGLAAALVVLVTAVVVADGGSSSDGDDVRASDTTVPGGSSTTTADTTTTTTSTTEPGGEPGGPGDGTVGLQPANGMLPGRAVLETPTGTIRTFGPDGASGETIQPDPQQPWSQPVRSDLAGGWVACGTAGTLVWYPAGQAPVVLSGTTPICTTETLRPLHVVNSADGPTVVYESATGVRAVVLASGQDRAVEIPDLPGVEPGGWSAATGGLLVRSEGRFRLFDIDTGDEIAIATVEAPPGATFVLAPDAATVALQADDEVFVVDLASGTEQHRQTLGANVFPFLSYDGTAIAVPRIPPDGSYQTAEVAVFDLATGSVRALAVYGIPL